MRRYLLFCALGALFGCRTASEPSGTAIALFCSTSEQSKTDILTVGEEVAVFAGPEGTEDYFLEAAQFIVGSDGRSLTYGSTVYYPDPKQAVRFLAYFPYHKGTFSVPTEQSTMEALKLADLCVATASTTPVATPVALAFEHLMARLVITTKEPTTRMVFPNAVASGVLQAATAEFVLGSNKTDISTTGNELIVPVQPLTRLVLTVSGVEYVFDTAPIALQAGQTTTLNLTLHPNTKTATLSGSSVTDWELVKTEGNPTHTVSNTLLLHWPSLPQGTTPDKVVFTIKDSTTNTTADYTVASGITCANQTFTVPFTSSELRYPYAVAKVDFYQSTKLVQSCANLLGTDIYKSGHSTVGINPSAVKIGNLWWATGNLVASNAVAGARGVGGCRIGAPADGGLYFQFGGLIGYKGGALANQGTGVGMQRISDNTYWNGTGSYSWKNEAMVWPVGMVGVKNSWKNPTGVSIATLTDYYFNYSSGVWGNAGQNIRDFAVLPGTGVGNLGTGRYATLGVGDPCSYYLGGTWRLPNTIELASITGVAGSGWIKWDKVGAGVTGRWATASETFGSVTGPGAWFGTGLISGTGTPSSSVNAFFSASGYRDSPDGSFCGVTAHGLGWSSSVSNVAYGHYLNVTGAGGVVPQHNSFRSFGFPVRCVSPVS